jgi:DNA-binding transcriptional regulator YiaG
MPRSKTPVRKKASNGAHYVLAHVGDLREKLNVSQQEFASLLGLSTVTVSRWEHGHSAPTDMSIALVGLIERALKRSRPDHIVATLKGTNTETDRFVTLVHLGD